MMNKQANLETYSMRCIFALLQLTFRQVKPIKDSLTVTADNHSLNIY